LASAAIAIVFFPIKIMASRRYDAMKAKYHRIQPRVQREIHLKFQNLAEQEGLDMSKLARKIIVQYINAKIQHRTPA
jgi:hypothetical protein